jgi:hypothetical protein
MTQAQRERRAKQISRMGWEAAGQLPIEELDEVAFGLTDGLHELPTEDIEIWDMDNWETAKAEVDADPERWEPYLDDPIHVNLQDGVLKLADGHHRLYTAILKRRRTIPVLLEIKDNPIRKIMAWAEDPDRVVLNPGALRDLKASLMPPG